MSTLAIAGIGFLVLCVYVGLRVWQENKLIDAYTFAHENTHTDRGFYPDEFEGVGDISCVLIANHFYDLSQHPLVWGSVKHRAYAEYAALKWMYWHLLTEEMNKNR